jgi:hypothetical protein
MMMERRMPHNHIPDPRAAGALSITSGHTTIGYLVKDGGSVFAFDTDFVLLGEYRTQREAVRELPPPIVSHRKQRKKTCVTKLQIRSF